jgi:hypothetical protein
MKSYWAIYLTPFSHRMAKGINDPEIAMQAQGELSCIKFQAKHHENKQWNSE